MNYRIFYILLSVVVLCSACSADTDKKSGWFFGLFPPREWPEEHWTTDQYESRIRPADVTLPAAIDKGQSMFTPETTKGLTPEQMIQNLQQADIIGSIYNRREGIFFQKTNDIIVEADHNFYTLSQPDQAVIAELLSKSYDSPVIIIKDRSTQKTVGTVTDGALRLY